MVDSAHGPVAGKNRRTMEQARDDISQILWTLEKMELIPLCEYLKCSAPTDGFASKAKRILIRLAEDTIDEIVEGEESEGSRLQQLELILSRLDSIKQSEGGTEAEIVIQETSELENLKMQYEKMQRQMEEEIGALEDKRKRTGPGGDATTVIRATKAAATAPARLPEVTLRREFRIIGQIGEAGQKEKLSYTSLLNQMESGQRKGHGEEEIIEAVTRAVSPGLHLREMLEIKRGLTLPTLKTILKGHYKVDSSSDLLHHLMNMTQDPKESAQNFLFRAIELKEKLMRKSSDDDAGEEGEEFSPELIQRKFLRSIETGLHSDAVKFQLKTYLSDRNVTDEVLIERISEAANLEQERQQKLRRTVPSKPPRVNEVQAEVYPPDATAAGVDTVTKCETGGKSKRSQGCSVETDQIEALKAEVLEMKKRMLQTVEATKSRQVERAYTPNRSRPRGCRACQEAQMGDSCRHCFKCGQEGHLSRGCRRIREPQGNETGLPGQDSR